MRPELQDPQARLAQLAREESKVPQVLPDSRVCPDLPAPQVKVASQVTRVFPEKLVLQA